MKAARNITLREVRACCAAERRVFRAHRHTLRPAFLFQKGFVPQHLDAALLWRDCRCGERPGRYSSASGVNTNATRPWELDLRADLVERHAEVFLPHVHQIHAARCKSAVELVLEPGASSAKMIAWISKGNGTDASPSSSTWFVRVQASGHPDLVHAQTEEPTFDST